MGRLIWLGRHGCRLLVNIVYSQSRVGLILFRGPLQAPKAGTMDGHVENAMNGHCMQSLIVYNHAVDYADLRSS